MSMASFVDWGNYHPYPGGGNSISFPYNYTTIARYYWRSSFPSVGLDEWPEVLQYLLAVHYLLLLSNNINNIKDWIDK
jgi:hypothetical protein